MDPTESTRIGDGPHQTDSPRAIAKREPRRPSARACVGCRAAKIKCLGRPGGPPCPRCAAVSRVCEFPLSQRGRPRGSKNRKTLEASLGAPVQASTFTAQQSGLADVNTHRSPRVPGEGGDAYLAFNHLYPTRLRQDASTPEPSGTITPLDPHNLMKDIDRESALEARPLTRQVLRTLGERFPIGRDRYEATSTAEVVIGVNDRKVSGALQSIVATATDGVLPFGGETRPEQARETLWSPYDSLHSDDLERLRKWNASALEQVIKDQKRYYRYGLHGSKLDVAPSLDPAVRCLLSEQRIPELFNTFWMHIHPFCAVLDPTLHTPSYVRSRSALLFTVVLTLGATFLATLQDAKEGHLAEAMRLQAHAEKLNLVAYTAGAKSCEIIQATILLSHYSLTPRRCVDEGRWIRLGACTRMAGEIGLHLPRGRVAGVDEERAYHLTVNDLRIRAWLLILDTRWYSFSGGFPSNLGHFELSRDELTQIERIPPSHADSCLPALYTLNMFQRSTDWRLRRIPSDVDRDVALDAEYHLIRSFLDRWLKKWCPPDREPIRNWHLRHDALTSRLLLYLRILGEKSGRGDHSVFLRENVLPTAVSIFEEALKYSYIPHLTLKSGPFVFAAGLILRLSDRRDLVLRMALRMAGDPERPSLNTFVRHNGQQMLSLLSQMGSLPMDSPVLDKANFCGTPRSTTVEAAQPTPCEDNHSADVIPETSEAAHSTDTVWQWTPSDIRGSSVHDDAVFDLNQLFPSNDGFLNFPCTPDQTIPQQQLPVDFFGFDQEPLFTLPALDLLPLNEPAVFDNLPSIFNS